MIRLDAVVKRYPDGHEALSGVSLDIEAGERYLSPDTRVLEKARCSN